jgi:hypothetical protein
MSNKQRTTNNEQRATSNEQRATCNEQRATSSEQRATSTLHAALFMRYAASLSYVSASPFVSMLELGLRCSVCFCRRTSLWLCMFGCVRLPMTSLHIGTAVRNSPSVSFHPVSCD